MKTREHGRTTVYFPKFSSSAQLATTGRLDFLSPPDSTCLRAFPSLILRHLTRPSLRALLRSVSPLSDSELAEFGQTARPSRARTVPLPATNPAGRGFSCTPVRTLSLSLPRIRRVIGHGSAGRCWPACGLRSVGGLLLNRQLPGSNLRRAILPGSSSS
jgi:hypothetical protein